jgi:vacuolar-type H+-ATPase subunit H
MEISDIIDMIEDLVENASSVPLVGKIMLDKEDILSLIQDLRLNMPEEIKQAKWVKEHRQKILLDAQKEYETMIKEAESKTLELINENEITQRATEKANEIVANAQNAARELRINANRYADEVFESLENNLLEYAKSVHASRVELRK